MQTITYSANKTSFLRRYAFALIFLMAPVALVAFPESINLTPPGFDKSMAATFPHWGHNQYRCYACHPSVFPQTRKHFTHADMAEQKYCGHCHDGITSFSALMPNPNCVRCHKGLGGQ